MLRRLLSNSESKIILLYIFTTALIYCFFWVGYYFLPFASAVVLSVVLTVLMGIVYAIFRKTTLMPILFVAVLSSSIGLIISSFFTATSIVPSRFFGLVLVIMLAYKSLQAFVGAKIKSRKLYYAFFTVSIALEIIALICVCVAAFINAGLYWQIFFTLTLCFFYSCTQIYFRKHKDENLWKFVANAYLLGFIFIFILVILLVISMLLEDGEPLGALFEGIGAGIDSDINPKKKRKK